MAKFIINTTGNLDPVIFYDLGYRTFYTASTINYDLSSEFTLEEISKSVDVQNSLNNNYITAKDEYGQNIYSSLTVNVVTISGGTNLNHSGSTFNPSINLDNDININSINAYSINVNNAIIGGVNISTGNTTINNFSATTISGGTIYSGSTNINDLFADKIHSHGQYATLSGATFTGQVNATSINSNTISGGTLYSGSTNLYDIFLTAGDLSGTSVSAGSNISVQQTGSDYKVSIVGSPSFNDISFSGSGNGNQFFSTTISGGTIYSGSTNLSNYFGQLQNDINQKFDKSGGTIGGDVVVTGNVTISGNTTIIGTATTINTEIVQVKDNNIILNFSGNHLTAIGGGILLVSGQTNGSPSEIKTNSNGSWEIIPGMYSTSISGDTIYSGTTNLYNIFQAIGSDTEHTIVQNGLNTYTGGTVQMPTINISGLTINNISVSGASSFSSVSATTIYSGSTNIYNLFADKIHSHSQYATLSGATFTGDVVIPNLSAITISGTSISANTFYSGSTNLYDIFAPYNVNGYVPYTGATSSVDLGANNFSLSGYTDYSGLTTNPPAPGVGSGIARVHAQTSNGITSIEVDNELTTNITIGRDSTFIVRNVTGSVLSKGSLVITTGSTGNVPNVMLAQANNETNAPAIGIVLDDILDNEYGRIMTHGLIRNVNTSAYNSGDKIWLSPTTPGGFTATRPFYPNVVQKIGTVLVSGIGNGSVQIMIAPALLGTETGTINNFTAPSLSANTISGSTLYSGTTNLYNIFQSIGADTDHTHVQNGLNTYTGGTANNPTVNISGLTIDNLNVSGNSRFETVSATTIYSGSTNINNLFADKVHSHSQYATLSGATFTGQVNVDVLSATTLSGETIISGSTNLYSIFQAIGSDTPHTSVQNGLNTYTGGTALNPTVNVSAATLNNLSVSGNSLFNTLSANTLSGGTMYSGATNLYNIFSKLGSDLTTASNGLSKNGYNITLGGELTGSTELQLNGNDIYFSGGTPSGSFNVFQQGFFSTEYYEIVANTFTGVYLNASDGNPTPVINSVGVNNLGAKIEHNNSGDSLSIELEPFGSITITDNVNNKGAKYNANYSSNFSNRSIPDVEYVKKSITGVTSAITQSVLGGVNIFTGGTVQNPTINLVSSPSVNGISFSGTAIGNSLSATTLSASTLYSGSTNLYDIFLTTNDGNDITRIQPGLNTYTGGTGNAPTVNISGLTIDNINVSGITNVNSISASTIYSGSTNLYSIFQTIGSDTDHTRVQNGLNTYTGGTASSPSINISGLTIDNISVSGISSFGSISASTLYSGSTNLYDIFITSGDLSGTSVSAGSNISVQQTGNDYKVSVVGSPSFNDISFSGTAIGNSLSATTISGGTIYSGSTNLYDIFLTTTDGNDITRVQSGLNTYTGGTGNAPTVNVSGLTIDNMNISGITSVNSISATTIYSGSTNISDLFADKIHSHGQYATLSGATFTGQVNASIISATTLSASTIISGSTNLYDIFLTTNDGNDITRIQPGLNTYTGGTGNAPTVNISGLTIDNINVSGSSIFNALSAVSLSASTIYSGSTNINSLFADKIHSHDQYATLSGATFTGSVNVPSLSATTLSASTLYSGSTNLYSIFQSIGTDTEHTYIQNGLNTYTGGTSNNPTINISGVTIDNIFSSGNSRFNTLSASTLSASTILSGSTNLYDIFHDKNGYLLQKAGYVSGSTFSGNPKKASVSFVTAFPSDSYAVTITGTVNRNWSIETKSSTGFTINSNANTSFNTDSAFWIASEIGEGYK